MDLNVKDDGTKVNKKAPAEWVNKWTSVLPPVLHNRPEDPPHPYGEYKKLVLYGSNEMRRYITQLVFDMIKYHKHEHPYPQNIIGRRSRERHNVEDGYDRRGGNTRYYFNNIMRMDMNYCHKESHEWDKYYSVGRDIYDKIVFKQ